MAKKRERKYPLDEHGNIDFNPMHKFTVKRTGKQVMRLQIMIRVSAMVVLALFIIVLLLYLFSLFSNGAGRFTVSSSDGHRGLILSETADFADVTSVLNAEAVEKMDNITYDWLPLDLTETDGSHNGKDYLCYTFYVKNSGKEDLDYRAYIDIDYVKLNVDDAARVQLYRNGEHVTYAKPNKDGNPEVDPRTDLTTQKEIQYETTPFVDPNTVCDYVRPDFKVGDVDKYTVVVWLEGWDPECVNDILGGELKMSMFFEVLDPEDAVPV